MFRIALKTCADLEGGEGLPTPPLENHNALGFVSIPGKLKMLDHHRLASVHFKWYLDALSSSSHQLKTVVKSWTPSHARIQEFSSGGGGGGGRPV